MTFQPLVPLSGLAGLRFIERTQESQQAVFNQSPDIVREVEYFRENIHKAATADDLTEDYLLLKVALGAFGLEEDQSKAYHTKKFETAVGNVDNSIRLAMNFKREIGDAASDSIATDTAWFQVMGNTPLRTVFETAFGLPTSVGALDIDRQLEIFKEKARATFGSESLTALQDTEKVEKLLNDFMVRDQLSSGPVFSTPGYSALSLLQNTGLGSVGTTNLLLSRF